MFPPFQPIMMKGLRSAPSFEIRGSYRTSRRSNCSLYHYLSLTLSLLVWVHTSTKFLRHLWAFSYWASSVQLLIVDLFMQNALFQIIGTWGGVNSHTYPPLDLSHSCIKPWGSSWQKTKVSTAPSSYNDERVCHLILSTNWLCSHVASLSSGCIYSRYPERKWGQGRFKQNFTRWRREHCSCQSRFRELLCLHWQGPTLFNYQRGIPYD